MENKRSIKISQGNTENMVITISLSTYTFVPELSRFQYHSATILIKQCCKRPFDMIIALCLL